MAIRYAPDHALRLEPKPVTVLREEQAARIPMAALAGILLVVAWNMGEWEHFLHLFRSPRSDVAVLPTTFGPTVPVDLAVALQAGIVLAALLFL